MPLPQVHCPVADCHLPINLVFESSDGVQFGVHAENLEAFAAGFPPENPALNGEVVKLGEFDKRALPEFLRFMHHTEQPELQKLNFSVVLQIAEGAEKYCVYSAKQLCRIYMRYQLEYEEANVLLFFARHDYLKDANFAVEWILTHRDKSRRDSISYSLRNSGHWRIYNAWNGLLDKCKEEAFAATEEPHPVLHKGGFPDCPKWRKFRNVVFDHQRRDPIHHSTNLWGFIQGEKYRLADCKWCTQRADKWRSWAGVDSSSRKFSDFLC